MTSRPLLFIITYFLLPISILLIPPLSYANIAEILESPALIDDLWVKGLAAKGTVRAKEISQDYIALAAICRPRNGTNNCYDSRVRPKQEFIRFHSDILPPGSYIMVFKNNGAPKRIDRDGDTISFGTISSGDTAFILYIPKEHFPKATVFAEQRYIIADGSSRIEVDPGMEVSTSISIQEGTTQRNLKKIIEKFSISLPLVEDVIKISSELENITENEVTVTRSKSITETFKHHNNSANKRWVGYYHVENRIHTKVEDKKEYEKLIIPILRKWFLTKKTDLIKSIDFELISIDPYTQPTRKAICIQQKEPNSNEYTDCVLA